MHTTPAFSDEFLDVGSSLSVGPTLPGSIPPDTLDNFCGTLDPLAFHHLQSSFAITPLTVDKDHFAQARSWNDSLSSTVRPSPHFGLYFHGLTPSIDQCFISSTNNHVPVVLDSGASRSLSPIRSDFVTFSPVESSLEGVGASAAIKGVGRVRWTVEDMHGVSHTIETQAYYVPAASIRLYSPQFHFMENMSGTLQMDYQGAHLSLPSGSSSSTSLVDLDFPFHPSNNLPLMLLRGHPALRKAMFSSSPVTSGGSVFSSLDAPNSPGPIFEIFDTAVSSSDLGGL